eukprot:TRINITY_DN426_c0_g1_i1.p1 TRINITY_DN426_c0_g1~~TRINITY_DN426_c0_g1_i1.p1  ORF type:complete len:332 (+),score=77.54 TRINITY_DN426_c0_g1_i1:380-1375(+)
MQKDPMPDLENVKAGEEIEEICQDFMIRMCKDCTGSEENIRQCLTWNEGDYMGNGYFMTQPKAECFMPLLRIFLDSPLGSTVQSTIKWKNPEMKDEIIGLVQTLIIDGVKGGQETVDLIEHVRNFYQRDEYKWSGSFLWGMTVTLYTQYIGLQGVFVMNCAYMFMMCAFVCIFFLLSPKSVSVLLLVTVASIAEVTACMPLWDMRLNGHMVMNFVVAVGFCMEFSAHISRAYNVNQGDPNQRLVLCLQEMFLPVTLGAVTTFIGILPIAFATFPYFVNYYFKLYCLAIIFGWLNGAVFQPVLLSLVVPASMYQDLEGKEEKEKVPTAWPLV